jgi:hypothetical protein
VNQYVAPDAALDEPLDTIDAASFTPQIAAAVEAARSFESARQRAAAAEVDRLAAALPLPQLTLPSLEVDRIGLAETRALAEELLTQLRGVEAAP